MHDRSTNEVLRAAWPAATRGKTNDYVDELRLIVCEKGAEPAETASTEPPPWRLNADGDVELLEWSAVRSAWRTGAALAFAACPRWRGIA